MSNILFEGRTRVSLIILTVYLWIVFSLHTISINVDMTVMFFVFLGIISFIIAFLVLKLFSDKIAKIKIDSKNEKPYVVGGVIAIVTFCVFMVYFAGQYPGGISDDTRDQIAQALGESSYNDWHPVLHTLLFFTLPLQIGHKYGLVVFLQLIYFSLAFGYLSYTIYKNGCPKIFFALFCLYTWLNPFMMSYMMYPWKDIGMTIFAVILMGYYIQIICTKGKWLNKKINLAVFLVVSVACSFMRHNAILFVLPLVCIVIFYALKSNKVRAAVIIGIIILFSLIKVVYFSLGVSKPDNRLMETIGLPLTIWCNVMQKNPTALPEETLEVMYGFASQEDYEKKYATGSFNSIKWSGFDWEKVDELSYTDVFKYTFQCFVHAPRASFEALAKLTNIVWDIDTKETPIIVSVEKNKWGISAHPFSRAETFVNQMKAFFSSGFGEILFGSIGFELLMMLIVALIMFAKRRFSFIHILPLFCYDFATMMLLSGHDYRFFLLNLPLWLSVIFIMLRDEKNMNFTKKKGNKAK